MNRSLKKCTISLTLVALFFAIMPADTAWAAKKVSLSNKKLSVKVGQTKTIKVKNAKKKVKWKVVSGKKNIRMKKKGTAKPSTGNPNTPSTGTSTGTATTKPSGDSSSDAGKNKEDVTALRKIIAEQKALGAWISEDINDKEEYTWDENGNLVSVDWKGKHSKGNLSLSELKHLKIFNCSDGYDSLNSLDVSGCVQLISLECELNELNSLDVSHNTLLTKLNCSNNNIVILR